MPFDPLNKPRSCVHTLLSGLSFTLFASRVESAKSTQNAGAPVAGHSERVFKRVARLSLNPSSNLYTHPPHYLETRRVMNFAPSAPPGDRSLLFLQTPLGRASLVPLEVFFDTFLPSMPSTVDFNLLLRRIARLRGPSCQIITKSGRLWGYAHKRPSDFERDDAYKYVYTAMERLAKIIPLCSQTHALVHNTENSWDSGERDADTLPDAYFTPLTDPEQPRTWRNVVIPGVYAGEATDVLAIMASVDIIPHCGNSQVIHRTHAKLFNVWRNAYYKTLGDVSHMASP